MTDAKSPTPMAIQSKAIWIARITEVNTGNYAHQGKGISPSEISPRLLVQTPYSIWTSIYAKFNIKK